MFLTIITILFTVYCLAGRFWQNILTFGEVIKTEFELSELREPENVISETREGAQNVSKAEFMSRSEEAIAGIHNSLSHLNTIANENKDSYRTTILKLLQGLKTLEESLKSYPENKA